MNSTACTLPGIALGLVAAIGLPAAATAQQLWNVQSVEASSSSAGRSQPSTAWAAEPETVVSDYGCIDSACLNNWRFRVHVAGGWPLRTVGLGDSAAVFFFFDHTNPELLIKVVDGCTINGHYWVFGSAATDQLYRIKILDFATIAPTRSVTFQGGHLYEHKGGGLIVGPDGYKTNAGVITNTTAFPCNPPPASAQLTEFSSGASTSSSSLGVEDLGYAEPLGPNSVLLPVTDLPEVPPWCSGTCVVDIAFLYAPDRIGNRVRDVFPDPPPGSGDRPFGPQNFGELRRNTQYSVDVNNVYWRRAGLDARLRIVGIERDPGLNGLSLSEALQRATERLPEIRRKYGADLLYALPGRRKTSDYAGIARLRSRGTTASQAARIAATGAIELRNYPNGFGVLTHEVGHNLGLIHGDDPGETPTTPSLVAYVPFGQGYSALVRGGEYYYGTAMSARGAGTGHFSTSAVVNGRRLGIAEVSDATRALRYTIPDAAEYSPTVVPGSEEPHDYGCRPSDGQACLNEQRFRVSAQYSTPSASSGAKQLDVYGLGDSGALFYFFDPGNPELLVKVVNGCWLNDHWWVFGSAATDLRYEVALEDLSAGGEVLEYRHHGGGVIAGTNGYSTGAGVITDTTAFPCARP